MLGNSSLLDLVPSSDIDIDAFDGKITPLERGEARPQALFFLDAPRALSQVTKDKQWDKNDELYSLKGQPVKTAPVTPTGLNQSTNEPTRTGDMQ